MDVQRSQVYNYFVLFLIQKAGKCIFVTVPDFEIEREVWCRLHDFSERERIR